MFEGQTQSHFAPPGAAGAAAVQSGPFLHPPLPAAPAVAQLAHGYRDGWMAVLLDILFGEKNGVFSVAWRMLRAPVKTSLGLAADPDYKGYWKFMLATMGADLTLLYVIVPWIGAHVFHAPAQDRGNESLMIQGLQLTGMPILTFLQFYLFSWLGTARRVPLEYVKLCSLSVGYGWLMTIVAMLIEAAAVLGMLEQGLPVDGVLADQIQTAATLLAVIGYVMLTHRQFWGMSMPRAFLSTLLISAISWAIVYPGLAWIARALDIAGRLKGIAS